MHKVRYILLITLIVLLISSNAQATRRARIVVTNQDDFISISQTVGKKEVACYLDKKGRLTPGVMKQRRQRTIWLNLKKRLGKLKRSRSTAKSRRKYRRLKRKIRVFRKACRDARTPSGPWTPPIGIPEPEFGIHETHQMYVGETFDFGSGPETYRDAGNGPYTHYVDNTHPNATDTNNTYGSASVPRMRIPRDLTAGSVVEVHGGPYTYRNGGDKILLTGDGTANLPIFIRGINRPEFRSPFNINGQYLIFENFYLYNCGISVRIPGGFTERAHHISLRNNETEGDGTTGGSGGIGTASDTITEHIVIYNNNLHHAGDYLHDGENDKMGTHAGRQTQHLWIVDNHIHHNGGDSFGGGHSAPEGSISHVYIGRNEMHDDGENAIDVKNIWDVIVSQNTMYGYPVRNSSSDGTIAVLHYGGTAEGPRRVWFLFNELYDAGERAIQIGGGARDEMYFIGNVIHDIVEEAFVSWSSRDLYFVGNTMYNVGGGIDSTGGASYPATIVNNIFGRLSNPSARQISLDYSTYNNAAIVNNNLFQDPINITPVCNNCLQGDPQFVDPANDNFHLQSSSPALSAAATSGAAQAVYDRFQQLYGIDIRIDKDGKALSAPWDMGAYEY